MSEEIKNPTEENPNTENENKEVTPEWAKNLQESLNNLPERIREAMTPAEPEEPEDNPQEIPVPQPPQEEEPPTPVEVETPQEEEPKKSKVKKFLEFLL